MAAIKKILDRILRGGSDHNIHFDDLRRLLLRLGFDERISGGHHTFHRAGVRELINIQREGTHAKAYQVRQVRRIIAENKLTDEL